MNGLTNKSMPTINRMIPKVKTNLFKETFPVKDAPI